MSCYIKIRDLDEATACTVHRMMAFYSGAVYGLGSVFGLYTVLRKGKTSLSVDMEMEIEMDSYKWSGTGSLTEEGV
jgi:hypothetical protein